MFRFLKPISHLTLHMVLSFKERCLLLSRFRQLESECSSLKHSLDDTIEAKADLQRQLSKATADATMWRAKYYDVSY